ncbi:hypothetical protein [Streptomyces luteireticuli]|uniref:hypothetical protein n=1 Tax=Streptomyces luteireticuli TaxID=173858 RepID=UPI003555D7C9
MSASLVVNRACAAAAGETWDAVRMPSDLARRVCRVFAAHGLRTGPVLLDERGGCVYFFVAARVLAKSDVPGAALLRDDATVVLPPPRCSVQGTPFGLRWLCPPDERGDGMVPLADARQLRTVLTGIAADSPPSGSQVPGERGSRLVGMVSARRGAPATGAEDLRIDEDGEDAMVSVDWGEPAPLPADVSQVVWVCERHGRSPRTTEVQVLREGYSPSHPQAAVRWLHTELRTYSSFLPPRTAMLLVEWITDPASRTAHTAACRDGRRLRAGITIAGITSVWSITPAITGTVAQSLPRRGPV